MVRGHEDNPPRNDDIESFTFAPRERDLGFGVDGSFSPCSLRQLEMGRQSAGSFQRYLPHAREALVLDRWVGFRAQYRALVPGPGDAKIVDRLSCADRVGNCFLGHFVGAAFF